MRVLGFSGGLSNPSKTLGLVQAIVNEFSHLHQVDVEIIDLAPLATGFGAVLYRNQLNGFHESLLNDIEQSDVLVVASPVYRAAYPGLFKHVFDLVERGGLVGLLVPASSWPIPPRNLSSDRGYHPFSTQIPRSQMRPPTLIMVICLAADICSSSSKPLHF